MATQTTSLPSWKEKTEAALQGGTEKRIEILMQNASGQPQWQSMPEQSPTAPTIDDELLSQTFR